MKISRQHPKPRRSRQALVITIGPYLPSYKEALINLKRKKVKSYRPANENGGALNWFLQRIKQWGK